MAMKISLDKKEISLDEIERKIDQAFNQTALQFGIEMTKVISTPGIFPDFPGDIIDTGALRASQLVLFPTRHLADYIWGVEYALYVHEGVTYRNGKSLPGRPWTWEAMKTFNWEAKFTENLQRLL